MLKSTKMGTAGAFASDDSMTAYREMHDDNGLTVTTARTSLPLLQLIYLSTQCIWGCVFVNFLLVNL